MSELFRKKSLDKISSPERIDEYIKTPRACAWAVLASVLILIVGALVWGVFGKLDITISAVAVCENNDAVCYVSEYDIDRVSENAMVKIDGKELRITHVSELPAPTEGLISDYAAHIGGFGGDEWVYSAELDGALKDGIYKCEIVAERISPVSMLLN